VTNRTEIRRAALASSLKTEEVNVGTRKLVTLAAFLLTVVLLGSAVPGCAPATGGAGGGDAVKVEYKWRFASPYSFPEANKSFSLFCTLIEEYSGGRVEVSFFPDGSLGSHDEVFSMVREGSLDMAAGAAMANLVPGGMTGTMPFSVGTWSEAAFAYAHNGPIMPIMSDAYRDVGLQAIWSFGTGNLGIANTVAPLKSPDDFKNLKNFRVSGSTQAVAAIRNMAEGSGMSLQTMPWADVYNALQLGVVDSCWVGWSTLVESRLTEVVKYFTPVYFLWDAGYIYFNADLWDSLSPDLQEAVMRAGDEAQLRHWEAYRRSELVHRQRIVEAGIEIYDLTAAEREAFIRKANTPAIWAQLVDPWLEEQYPGQNKSAALQRELDSIRVAYGG
jgi:TRAP-type C4-dicarboxylate transport system substrate-binding protein